MMIGMVIFRIVVVALIVWAVRAWSSSGRTGRVPPPSLPAPRAPPPPPRPEADDPVSVVKRRYAAGEMDRDEFLQKLGDLGAPPPAGS